MFRNQVAQTDSESLISGIGPHRQSFRRVVIAVLTAVATSAVFIAGEGLPLGTPKSALALDSTFVPRLIAGGGALGHSPDGENAVCPTAPGCAGQSFGRINYPIGMAVHPVSGEFFFSQGASDNGAELNTQFVSIRRVTSAGTMQTVIGDGLQTSSCTSSCDGAVNTSTQQLRNPGHMVFNSSGTKLFVLDGFAGIREVTFSGTPSLPTAISTLTHSQIPASINSMAQVSHTGGLAMDSNGALYFGGRVLDQSMSSLLRLSVFKRTASGVVTEVVSSNSAASGAPTQKQGIDMYSGPRDIKVVGEDLYVLYDNKLIRTNLSGNLEAEYTLTNAVQARSIAVLDSTIYVGLTTGGRIVTFPDNAPSSTAVTPTQTVRFGTAANETFALGSTQSSIELTGPRSMMVNNGALYISDMNQQVLFSAIIAIVAVPAVTPATQTVSGTADTAITASTAFTATDFTGAVTYAVTNGTLPAGLSLSSTTGVVSGTPTADSTDTLTITATGATAGSATATITFAIAAAPTVVPSTQTVSGTTGTAVTASTAFTPANFTGSVTYAVTNGALPAGLSLSSTTGVVSGTPTAASTATVTITASGATAGTATATITFAIAVAPTTTTTAPAAPTTTVAPAVTTPTTLPDAPQLVTSENQALLESAPGEATAIVNGKAVAVETIKVEAAATTKELEATGQNIVNILSALTPSGSVNPVKLVKTSDGPVLTGLIVNPYDSTEKLDAPVESVTLVKAGESAVLISALNITNLPAPVAASGSIEVTRGGVLAARSYGLPSLETGEIVLMSTPRLLQKFTVDKDGSFSGQVALPRDVALGSHTVVMATKNVKVSLGITLVATKLMFRIKSTIGTRLFEKRAGVKKVGGIVTVTGAGRCKAKLGKITMNKKPGKCFITVKQAAQGSNRALFSRFTVTVVKKLPKVKKW